MSRSSPLLEILNFILFNRFTPLPYIYIFVTVPEFKRYLGLQGHAQGVPKASAEFNVRSPCCETGRTLISVLIMLIRGMMNVCVCVGGGVFGTHCVCMLKTFWRFLFYKGLFPVFRCFTGFLFL